MQPASLFPPEKKTIMQFCNKPDSSIVRSFPGKGKIITKWGLTLLPSVGIVWVSFLTLAACIGLFTLLWLYGFFLLDTFFLGG